MTPTAKEIEQFIEVFHIRHLSKAALRLGVTQPALTQCIQKLERKVGGKLFHRSPQGMVPTKLGVAVYKNSSALQDAWANLLSDARAIREGLTGRFRVGCHSSVAGFCIPQLLRRLDQSAPKIELELMHDFSRKILEKVVSFDLDLGFVINPIRHLDLVIKPIGEDIVKFWVRPGKPAVPHRLIVDLSVNQTEKILARAPVFKGWPILHSESLEVVRTLTVQGLGVGWLPQRVALADGPLLSPYRSKHTPEFRDRIFLVYRKDALTGEAGRALLEAASHGVGALPTPAY